MRTPVQYFLTRVVAPAALVSGAYDAHRLLWQAFPGRDGQPQPFTFRLEEQGGEGVVILMQSIDRPDFSMVFGVQAQIKEMRLTLREGDVYAFRARVNPTRSIHPRADRVRRERGEHDHTRRGTRVPIGDQAGIHAWMQRQAQDNGFEIQDVVFSKRSETVRIGRGRSGRQVPVSDTRFDGCLRVSQPEAFMRALTTGIGRGKSYGFGMLSIAKLY